MLSGTVWSDSVDVCAYRLAVVRSLIDDVVLELISDVEHAAIHIAYLQRYIISYIEVGIEILHIVVDVLQRRNLDIAFDALVFLIDGPYPDLAFIILSDDSYVDGVTVLIMLAVFPYLGDRRLEVADEVLCELCHRLEIVQFRLLHLAVLLSQDLKLAVEKFNGRDKKRPCRVVC